MIIVMNSKFLKLLNLIKLKNQVKNLPEYSLQIQTIFKIYFMHQVLQANNLWKMFKKKCKNILKMN